MKKRIQRQVQPCSQNQLWSSSCQNHLFKLYWIHYCILTVLTLTTWFWKKEAQEDHCCRLIMFPYLCSFRILQISCIYFKCHCFSARTACWAPTHSCGCWVRNRRIQSWFKRDMKLWNSDLYSSLQILYFYVSNVRYCHYDICLESKQVWKYINSLNGCVHGYFEALVLNAD